MSLFWIYIKALTYLSADRKKVFFICICNVVFSIATIAEPVVFGRVVDAITEKGDFIPPLAFWAGLGAFNIIAVTLASRGADRIAHARRAIVLAQSYRRIISMPLAWHQKEGSSNLLHGLLRATESLFTLWLEFMRTHLATAMAFIFLVPVALSMDVRMSAVLFALGFAYIIITRLVMKKTSNEQAKVEKYYHTVFEHITDTINNISVLQSYDRVRFETEILRNEIRKLLSAQNPVLDWWAVASALNRLSATICMMIILAVGSYLVISGELRIGELVAFTGFASILVTRLDQLSSIVNQIFEFRPKLETFYRIESESSLKFNELEGRIELNRPMGHIQFENVQFGFENSSVTLDLSFELKAGQTVAIVGPAGSGKTTLINLLQRIYTPHSGRILIDGIDIAEVTTQSLRRSIATVFQQSGLFNRSIRKNIQVGDEEASDKDIYAAAEKALAHDFIITREQRYESEVGEQGSRLSGGERQRIAIARALLRNSPILILDEATSALDVETEEKLKKIMKELRCNRTTIMIAHRLTTVRDADVVIFMERGRIIEMGSFDELSWLGGRFSEFLQLGGLLEENREKNLNALKIISKRKRKA